LQYQILDKQAAEKDVTLLVPGRFQESSDGNSIIYIQQQTGEGVLANIFLARKNPEQTNEVRVIVAQQGQITVQENNDKYISLKQGRRYQGEPGRADFKIAVFDEYLARFQESDADKKQRKLVAVSSAELFNNKDAASTAELQWRISTGISAMILMMLAVPLARVKPRQGKYAKIGPGLLIYVAYLTLMILAKNWLENERIPGFIGLWWVHLIMLIFVFWKLDLFSRNPAAKK
jgi:lipopolysaccharide export system permease protein